VTRLVQRVPVASSAYPYSKGDRALRLVGEQLLERRHGIHAPSHRTRRCHPQQPSRGCDDSTCQARRVGKEAPMDSSIEQFARDLVISTNARPADTNIPHATPTAIGIARSARRWPKKNGSRRSELACSIRLTFTSSHSPPSSGRSPHSLAGGFQPPLPHRREHPRVLCQVTSVGDGRRDARPPSSLAADGNLAMLARVGSPPACTAGNRSRGRFADCHCCPS
jgi:hypothetical protein